MFEMYNVSNPMPYSTVPEAPHMVIPFVADRTRPIQSQHFCVTINNKGTGQIPDRLARNRENLYGYSQYCLGCPDGSSHILSFACGMGEERALMINRDG